MRTGATCSLLEAAGDRKKCLRFEARVACFLTVTCRLVATM